MRGFLTDLPRCRPTRCPTPQDVPEEEAAPSGGAPAVRYKLGDFGLATRLDRRAPAEFDEGDCR